MPLAKENAFSFVDPKVILRASHIIPTFSRGQRSPDGNGLSPLVKDKDDWHKYYINREESLREIAEGEEDEEDEEEYVCIKELTCFQQEQNGSTESLVGALDKMFTNHEYDYEN
ncbi:uncharacterized protein EDB93DRAFT_1108614 [Suillus bovinus]|uniref:uncharacterized protein n=1 Tax=Suillus bovinus TaxID=48563 RepID=UPI001B8635D8|nr:uncharacterized protein EDB93DRAFT_1108614 [Suillus bovinus]KAG2129687.1 hypothetical protein EDB93DRAFT_1108614 [Suillus bovinus]